MKRPLHDIILTVDRNKKQSPWQHGQDREVVSFGHLHFC